MGMEDALHFGLIPRLHRGIFAMNELPELDELVQVGLFNILEERDVQIRGYPVKFDIDVLILFSANPATYNRSGKVIPQLKDRIGSIIHTHYPLERDLGIQIVEQEVDAVATGGPPVAAVTATGGPPIATNQSVIRLELSTGQQPPQEILERLPPFVGVTQVAQARLPVCLLLPGR